jgi:hypothetical protein
MATKDKGSNDGEFEAAKFKLGETSAARLAALSGIEAKALVGQTLGEVASRYQFRLDPQFLFFRRICGRVVKTDPATGISYPVPFATVQVEDTDCSFLGYFPHHHPWAWYFPFRCRREVIATTRTDECGNFCVWVPRWDIDWVLRWRRERRCFGHIFDRPSIRDLVGRLDDLVDIEWPPRPIPEPDPAPFRLDRLGRARVVKQAGELFGRTVAARLDRLAEELPFGAELGDRLAELDSPAALNLAPPLPPELKVLASARPANAKRGDAAEAARAASTSFVGGRVALDPRDLKQFDLRHYVGPFFRCYDVHVAEWVPIFDVPDITFKVLQDIDGDGVEEVIYGEGHFDVRWNAGPLPYQTIEAWPIARAGNLCGPVGIPCADVPALVTAGRLPLTGAPTVFDSTAGDASAGYALTTNRPRTGGSFAGAPIAPGHSPLLGTLPLYGCVEVPGGASHYRVVYRYSANAGATFTSAAPFTGISWPLYRLNGMGIGEWHYPSADAQGWYPIALPGGPNPWLPQNLVLDWPTGSFADGLYLLTLQLGSGGAVSASSAEVAIQVDNSAPVGPISVGWSFSAAGPFTPLSGICPVVNRGAVPQTVYFRVQLAAAAGHLRSAELAAYGCGAGDFVFQSGTGGEHVAGTTLYRHWHQTPADNDQLLTVIYALPGSAAQGTYSFAATVAGRAFSPVVSDQINADPVHSWVNPSLSFSVFNA